MYWHSLTKAKNLFKKPKDTNEVKLSDFEKLVLKQQLFRLPRGVCNSLEISYSLFEILMKSEITLNFKI